jgi:hypothetical protein
MENAMMRRVAVACLLMALVGCDAGRDPSVVPRHSAAEGVVREFCQLDYDGARLDDRRAAEWTALVTWKESGAADAFDVIDGFDVGAAQIAGARATVSVTYRLAGHVDGEQFEPAARSTGSVVFALEHRGDAWKISGPAPAPHVSRHAARESLGALLAIAGHGSDSERNLQAALRRLSE